jgi:hypothetical protein
MSGQAAIRHEHLPALAAIHERILDDPDLCHALAIVMVMAGYLTEEASNPMGAHWHGDASDA